MLPAARLNLLSGAKKFVNTKHNCSAALMPSPTLLSRGGRKGGSASAGEKTGMGVGTGGEREGKGGGGEARVSQPITRQSLPKSLARTERLKM